MKSDSKNSAFRRTPPTSNFSHALSDQRESNGFLIDIFKSVVSRKQILGKAGIMAGARVLAMAFGAVGAIYAARCLGPHNLGISGMVQNIVAQASLLLGVIFPTILVREYKNAATDEARNDLVRISTTFRFIGALIFGIIGIIVMAFHLVPSDYHFAGWFFIPLLLLGAIQPAWVFQAAEKQHFQSMIAVLQPALAAGLYLWYFRPGMSAGADLAVISAVIAVLTIIYWRAIYKLTPMKGNLLDFQGFQKAWKLILQSRWLFISSLAIYIYTTLEQPLLGWLYSIEELGKYRTAVTVVGAANAFFVIIPTILYPRFIEWRKRGEEILWRRQLKLAALFSVSGGLIVLLGFILIPVLYPLVFGPVFVQAAMPCAILIFSKLIVIPSGIFVFGLMTDQTFDKTIFISSIGAAIFSIIFNFIFIPKFGMYATAIINLLSESILFLAFFSISVKRMKMIRAKS